MGSESLKTENYIKALQTGFTVETPDPDPTPDNGGGDGARINAVVSDKIIKILFKLESVSQQSIGAFYFKFKLDPVYALCIRC